MRLVRICAAILGVVLTGATGPSAELGTTAAPVGFANITRLLALHPLHKMLDAYDREIVALQRTRVVPGLEDPAARAQHGAAALANESAAAQARIQRIPARDAADDRTRERSAIAAVAASRNGSSAAMAAYRSELAQETQSNARGFSASIATRNERALAARRQQLLEKELTLGYDIARRDAGKRLLLRVRLADLHLSHAKRAALQGQLSEMDRRREAAVAAMRRTDAGILSTYAGELAREGSAADAAMNDQLQSKAAANLAMRYRVLQSESRSASVLPDLPTRLDWFASTYRFDSDAGAIVAGLRSAATDVTRRFAQVAAGDRSSRAQVGAQIAQLRNDRRELYRTIVAQIAGDAQRIARERHLRGLVLSGSRPRNSVDLTGEVGAELARL